MPIRLTPIEPPLEQPETEAPVLNEIPPSSNGTSIASNGSGPLPPLRYSRYQGLDHTDLLHVIDEIEASRNWASLREKLWIALIVHLLIIWFLFYGSKHHLFTQVRVINPVEQIRNHPKQLTYLTMPKDLQQQVKPKPTPVISDKTHVAETPHPTVDRKTLEELEAMRRAGLPKLTAPPAPRPAPAPPRSQPAPQQAQRPTPPAQPLPQNNQARLTAPPMAPVPNLRTGPSNPNQQLQNAMRQAMQGGELGGDNGLNSPSQHQGIGGAVDILSETMGVDFGPYIQRVIYDTERAWYPIIPEEARPPFNKQGQVYIEFVILPNGNVTDMRLVGPSGDVALDRAAWAGITGASPFPPLPKAFKGPYLRLRFDFLYNQQPGGN
jgi:TonB family protein